MSKGQTLGVMGQGKLYRAFQSRLERAYHAIPISLEHSLEEMASCSLVLYCSEVWSPATLYRLNQQCIRLGIALLPVSTYFNMGIIGPCVLPHRTGCALCADQRKLGALWSDAEHELQRQHSATPRDLALKQPWLTTWSIEALLQLTCAEINAYGNAPEQLQTQQALIYLALDTLKSSLHRFLPISDCPACSNQQPDTSEPAAIVLQARPKPGPFSYHVRDLAASIDELFATYVDEQTGVIGKVILRNSSLQPHTSAFAKIVRNGHWGHLTSMGTATRWDQSKVVALAEALERHAGQYPSKKRRGRFASYHQLNVPALDPTTLVLHSPEQYARPDFAFVPYHHDLTIQWVWGYSFRQQQPILVPETCAYYGEVMRRRQKDSFVYEISNGCALGGNLEEAILYGILEVAERDAFLLTWYAQLALTRLDLASVTDPALRLLVKRIEQISGYTLIAFDATLDHAVPCLWVMAVDEGLRPDRPRFLCTGGSHPHPERALAKALQELGVMLTPPVGPELFVQERERLLTMLHNPFEVRNMEDHARLYWLPEAFERLSFLYHSPKRQSFQEAFRNFYQSPPSCLDLREDLNHMIDHYLRLGLDVVVVNQTTPEQELHDLRCTKVLIPGTLSMTFGHAHRRTTGCQRLYELPHALGYCEHPLSEAEINPHPHPFP